MRALAAPVKPSEEWSIERLTNGAAMRRVSLPTRCPRASRRKSNPHLYRFNLLLQT